MDVKPFATGAGVALSLTLGAASLLHRKAEPPPAAQPGPPLQDTASVWAVGKVEAWRQATVASKVNGRLERLVLHEGDAAKKGQQVALLERSRQEADLERAQARRDQAERDYKRARALWKTHSLSEQDKEAAASALAVDEAELKGIAADLADREMVAPFDGTILKTYPEEGEGVTPGKPVFSIGDLSALKIRVEVDELEMARIRPNARVRAWPDAMPDKEFDGVVTRISGMLGRKTISSDDPSERADAHVLEIEVKLDPYPELRPGMTMRVAFESREGK